MGCCQTISQEKAEFDMLFSTSSLKRTKPTQEQESDRDESFNDISLNSSTYDRLHGAQDYNNQASFIYSLSRSQDQFLACKQDRSLTNSFNLETAMSCASTKILGHLYKETDSRETEFKHFTVPYRINGYRKTNPVEADFTSQAQHLTNRLEEMKLSLTIQRPVSDLITDSELQFDLNDPHGSKSPLAFEIKQSLECGNIKR